MLHAYLQGEQFPIAASSICSMCKLGVKNAWNSSQWTKSTYDCHLGFELSDYFMFVSDMKTESSCSQGKFGRLRGNLGVCFSLSTSSHYPEIKQKQSLIRTVSSLVFGSSWGKSANHGPIVMFHLILIASNNLWKPNVSETQTQQTSEW